MQHSPTPWRVHDGGIIDAEGKLLFRMIDAQSSTQLEGDMRRIVACVNAFEGVSTHAIEDHVTAYHADNALVEAFNAALMLFTRRTSCQSS